MEKSYEIVEMCDELVQKVYAMYGNRDESIKNEITLMNAKIEEVLDENQISARAKQVVIEKLLGETAYIISKTLETRREDTYSEMHSIVRKYYEEEQEVDESVEYRRTKERLEEQNETSKISITKLENVFQEVISNAINYLNRIGIPYDELMEIKLICGGIKNNTISKIENEVKGYDKCVKQAIEETLGEIRRQIQKEEEEKQEGNPWRLSPEEEAEFREGEKNVLQKYERGPLDASGIFDDIEKETKHTEYKELSADDIF